MKSTRKRTCAMVSLGLLPSSPEVAFTARGSVFDPTSPAASVRLLSAAREAALEQRNRRQSRTRPLDEQQRRCGAIAHPSQLSIGPSTSRHCVTRIPYNSNHALVLIQGRHRRNFLINVRMARAEMRVGRRIRGEVKIVRGLHHTVCVTGHREPAA